ncbi:MAG: DUF2513 domain-containing protein [Candidatus Cloacimonadales bacterium]
MKLDMDLVRTLLLEIEKNVDLVIPRADEIKIAGLDESTKDYHLFKMSEGGLLSLRKMDLNGGGYFLYEIQLTWDGHQFIDQVRKDDFWNKLKAKAISSGAGLTLLGLKAAIPILITELIKQA